MPQDFIARAGGMMDRAHHVAGVLVIALIAMTVMVFYLTQRIEVLNYQIDRMQQELKVYVVPGSLAGTYSPTNDQILLRAFTTLITQSLNSFTYENIAGQYNEVKKFFSPKMLVYTDDHYAKVIRQANIDGRSQMFVPDDKTYKVRDVRDSEGKPTGDKVIEIVGQLNRILSGSVVEAVPLKVRMDIKKVAITPTNPFGFTLQSYQESELSKEEFGKLMGGQSGAGSWIKTQAEEQVKERRQQ